MSMKKYAATALLAIAALGITDGTASAAPDLADTAPHVAQGTDQGVGFTFQGGKRTTLDATLTGGSFRQAQDAVEIVAGDGTVVATLPLAVSVEDQVVTLAPHISADGTTMVADVSAQDVGYWRKTSPRQRSIEAGAGIGAAFGTIAGLFVGMALGVATAGMLLPITLPVGLIAGMIGGMALGAAAGASIPNSDIPDQWHYELECRSSGNYRFCW
ncbi:hypothetical protein [Nocardia noduli]|uniref:hypothetical protein n=1 Tax=Nocardia noduli TaxID=2815722 RepID=UPI001C222040|nr:hypothetical protein [Nocardia noduli]